MRVMFASTRGAGHLGPLLPLADACRRAGHHVLIAAPRLLEARVAQAGHAFWPLEDPPAEARAAIYAAVPSLGPDEQNRIVAREVFGRLNVTATLPGHLAACREWRPDLIVRETSEYGSALAAERAGIPQARVGIGLAAAEEAGIAAVGAARAGLRRPAGLGPAPHGDALRAAPSFTWFPESLEAPAAPCPADTVRLRDPAWDAWPIKLPSSWWDGGSADPLVYVTFGSV